MAKKLERTTDDRWVGGVCGGLAEYTGQDANLIRLVLVIGTFFAGATIVIYLLAWVIVPEASPYDPGPTEPEPPPPSA